MIIVVLVLAGLVLGSFVNALVWRFHAQSEKAGGQHKTLSHEQLSMLKGRSMCSNCHHELAPKDLVPLLSWLYLRGKCRYCKKPIQDSPFIELSLPILFAVSYLAWPVALHGVGLYDFVFWLIFLTGFVALAAYDFRWYLLPDRIVFPLIGLAATQFIGREVVFGFSWHDLLSVVWGVLIASGIFYVLFQVSKGTWIGGGDVKLGILLGILVGGPTHALLLLFLASLLGTVIALPLMATGRAHMTSKLPFGPYLLAATVLVVLFGDSFIRWYYSWIDALVNTLMV